MRTASAGAVFRQVPGMGDKVCQDAGPMTPACGLACCKAACARAAACTHITWYADRHCRVSTRGCTAAFPNMGIHTEVYKKTYSTGNNGGTPSVGTSCLQCPPSVAGGHPL